MYRHIIAQRCLQIEKCKSPHLPCILEISRGLRTKRGTRYYDDPLRRDERMLRRLETQLENVKAKINREEAEAAEALRHQKPQDSKASDRLEDQNEHIWKDILSQEDRKELAMNGIHTLGQLYSVHQEAEAILSKPPYPKTEKLPTRLRIAHQMYNSIPEKLSRARQQSAHKSWFGGWL